MIEHFTKIYNKDIVESALKDFSFNCSERKKENSETSSATTQNFHNSFTSIGKNKAQYTVNGVHTGGKCHTVRYVIETYVKNNPGISFEQLQKAFPDEAGKPGFKKVIRLFEDVKDAEWSGRRFDKYPIILSDGHKIAVSTQWTPENMEFPLSFNFIKNFFESK